MMKRIVLFLLATVYSIQAVAFTCYLTIVKNSCWKDFTVTVTVMNVSQYKKVATIQVPAYESWARGKFSCDPKDTLVLSATYSPVFWKADQGKVYQAKRNWALPQTITKGTTAWSITTCFSEEFSEVPLPPEATGNCQCDIKQVTKIKL